MFKMRDIVAGKRKAKPEAHAIKDDDTNELVVSNQEIKNVSLKYCLKVLKNNEPDEAFKELKELKERAHKLRMEDKEQDDELDISEEDLFGVLNKFEVLCTTL